MFGTLYINVLAFESVDETLVCDYSNESYWAVQSCVIMLYRVLALKSVDETLMSHHEGYWAVLSFGTVFYTVHGGSNYNFKFVDVAHVCNYSNESYHYFFLIAQFNI